MSNLIEEEDRRQMIKIGKEELVGSYTLLIPENSMVRIPLDIKGWKFSLDIEFDNTSEKQGVDRKSTAEGAIIVFRKWNNPLGTALIEPVPLGTLANGQKLFFMASNYVIGGTNKLDLQLLLGGV